MMTRDLLRGVARSTGLGLFQQEKHYFLTLVLRALSSSFGQNLVFKGGTCLFFFYSLRRFSEGLDFTSNSGLKSERIVPAVLKDLELRGIEASFRITSDSSTSYSVRFGLKGPLFESERNRNFIKIEISRREEVLIPPEFLSLDPIYAEVLPFSTLVMNVDEIFSEKIRAVMTRNQARDVFDLWFLSKAPVAAKFIEEIVNSKLSYCGKRFDMETLIASINRKEALWETELRPLVFGKLPGFEEVAGDLQEFRKN